MTYAGSPPLRAGRTLAVPYASRIEPRIEPMSEAVKGGKGDQTQSLQSGSTATGLRGSLL